MSFGRISPVASSTAQSASSQQLVQNEEIQDSKLKAVIKNILNDQNIKPLLKTTLDVIDCSALTNVSSVSLQNVAYAFAQDDDQSLVKEYDNAVSTRLRYLEAALMVTASIIYNVVFGAIFSVVSLVTLGQIKMLTDQMRKHWTHAALSVGATAVAAVGIILPKLGIKANVHLIETIVGLAVKWADSNLAGTVATVYQRYHDELVAAAEDSVDEKTFQQKYAPLFEYLDRKIQDGMTIEQLREIISRVINDENAPDDIKNPLICTTILAVVVGACFNEVLGRESAPEGTEGESASVGNPSKQDFEPIRAPSGFDLGTKFASEEAWA